MSVEKVAIPCIVLKTILHDTSATRHEIKILEKITPDFYKKKKKKRTTITWEMKKKKKKRFRKIKIVV